MSRRPRQQMPPLTSPGRTDYLTRLLQAHAHGAFKPGTVTVLTVAHEPPCQRAHGGPCTCQPDLTATDHESRTDIDADGKPTTGGTA